MPSESVRGASTRVAQVQHPNVVRLYGVCVTNDGAPSVVMALASRTLENELTRPILEPSPLLNTRLLRGVVHGMAAVHAQQITHRDLKPQNVLLSAEGVPWITDFGLSTSMSASGLSRAQGLSRMSAMADGRGTLSYKGPELFRTRRSSGTLDFYAAEGYAFAILAFYVLTRFEPWSDLESPETAIAESVKAGERPVVPNDDSDEVDWRAKVKAASLVESCWAQEPAARPTFIELADRLDELEAEASRHNS